MILDVRRAAVGIGLLVAITTPMYARAMDLHNVLTGYALASWTDGEGRSLGEVSAIVQDLSGYLWLSTSTGLIRFDGWRFARWETIGATRLPDTHIVSLCASRQGGLWLGFADGTVRRIKDNKVVETAPAIGDGGPALHLAEDHHGTVWMISGETVRRLRGGHWEKVILESGPQAQSALMLRAIGAHVWISSRDGLFKWIEENDSFQRVLYPGALDVAEDASQRLWMTDFKHGFRSLSDSRSAEGPEGKGFRLLSDRRGNLWVATIGEGLWRVQIDSSGRSTVEKASLNTGLLSDSVEAVIEDREGNIWIGTAGGLQRLTERTFTPAANIGLVTALEADATTVWAGTNNGLFRLTSNGERWVREPKQPSGLWVRSVHVDRRGTLWVGSAKALFRMNEGRLEPVSLPPGTAVGPIDSLTSDSFGCIWFSGGSRLFRWQHERLEQVDVPGEIGERQIAVLYADSSDRLWIAYREGSVEILDAATGRPDVTGLTRAAHQTVYDIFEDPNHVTWILGSGGLTKSHGRVVTLAPEQGIPHSVHGAIVSDGHGELWLNTDGGLLRFSEKAFDGAVQDPGGQLQYQFYDNSDGVAGAPIVKLLARKDANGRLWFVRGGALTSVTSGRFTDVLPPQPRPQFVRIESVVTNDGAHDLSQNELPSTTRRIAITYTALALTAPNKIRFRYRLDGFDADWVDAGTQRQAFYTNLAPGAYVFRVEASANGRRWNDSSASWSFRREPTFVQTRVFYFGSVVLLGLVAVGIWKLRINVIHREFAAALAERLRLSREIHDTLLQNLVGLALQFDSLADSLGSVTTDGRNRLVRTRKQVESYVREARQSIYELRSPSHLTCPDLATSLTEFGMQNTAGTTVAFEVHVEGEAPEYSATLRRAVTRIGQEAITNAVRHADARQIRLDLRFETDAIVLRVADDGCGFDVDLAQSGVADHYGLISMRERAEDVGAQLRIISKKGHGTTVELRSPFLND
jgi:signal transduction histidine kinase/ligand-binding sensor domain-containing protein